MTIIYKVYQGSLEYHDVMTRIVCGQCPQLIIVTDARIQTVHQKAVYYRSATVPQVLDACSSAAFCLNQVIFKCISHKGCLAA